MKAGSALGPATASKKIGRGNSGSKLEQGSASKNDKKSVSCPDCKKTFLTEAGMHTHRFMSHGVEQQVEGRQHCPKCGVVMKVEKLERHRLKMHASLRELNRAGITVPNGR